MDREWLGTNTSSCRLARLTTLKRVLKPKFSQRLHCRTELSFSSVDHYKIGKIRPAVTFRTVFGCPAKASFDHLPHCREVIRAVTGSLDAETTILVISGLAVDEYHHRGYSGRALDGGYVEALDPLWRIVEDKRLLKVGQCNGCLLPVTQPTLLRLLEEVSRVFVDHQDEFAFLATLGRSQGYV